VITIVKDKTKLYNDLNNQRPITISNALAQLFERLLLEKMTILHRTNKSQFGFKSKSFCGHAIFTLNEIVRYNIENNSNCYIISLDAEKAFDRVWRDGLMHKLINKIDNDAWNILKKYYDLNYGIIKDDNELNLFQIMCGVKQGGILSPYFPISVVLMKT
jgi:hypothetical protein